MLMSLVVSYQFQPQAKLQVKDARLDPCPGLCCPHDTAETGAEEFCWSGMLQTRQHVEIPSSDEGIRKRADKPILLHTPVVAD